MNGPGSRHRLRWLTVTGSLLTAATAATAVTAATAATAATTSVSASAAVTAPRTASVSGGTIKICQCITSMAADSNTNTLWLVNTKAKIISVVSEKTKKVLATIKLGPQLGPNAIGSLAVDPASGTVWDFAGGDLVKISDHTMKVVHILKPKAYRPGFSGVVDPARGEVWAVSEETIQGISESTGKVLSTVFLADGAKQDSINGLTVDSKTGTVFAVVNKFEGTRTWLIAVDEASETGTVFRKLAGGGAAGLAADASAGLVWVNRGSVLNGYSATGRHKAAGSITISPPRFGDWTIDPTTGSIWMAAASGKVLTRFGEIHRGVLKTLPLPGPSSGITVDTKSHTVFTLNSQNRVIQFYRY